MRLKGFISIAVSVLVMLLVRYGVGRLLRAERAAEAAMQVSLAKDTVEAAKDTSRDLPLIGALGDSLRAAQRRAVQVRSRT